MKIYLDNIIFSLQKAGGISVVWYEIINRALNDPEIEPIFLECPNQNSFRQLVEISQKNIINSNSKIPTSIQRYFNPKLKNETGIFHSSYYRVTNNPNIVNVTTVHDFTYEYFRNGLPKFIHSNQKENAINKAHRIICVSENTKADLLKFFPKTDDSKIKVIYNGVDSTYRILDDKYSIPTNKTIPFAKGEFALYVGDRKSNYKNFKIALRACKIAKTPLVLIGGGAVSKAENTYIKTEIGKNNYIHLAGINNEQLNFIYNHALCLLYPSVYEGFGIPVIEAQKAGCPVIATNNSSIPEVIGPVSTLVNLPTVDGFAEMISQLKTDYLFYTKQKEIGLKNSKRFSWNKCYEQTKNVYKELYDQYFL